MHPNFCKCLRNFVGPPGFEPETSCTPSRRAAGLRYGATGGWRPETGGWRGGDGLPLILHAGFLAQFVIPAHQFVFMAHLVLIEPVKKLS